MKSEFGKFNQALEKILKADPKAVKAAMEAEIREHAAERKARGQRKRGRKPRGENDNRDENNSPVE